jgi:hypothetical protein
VIELRVGVADEDVERAPLRDGAKLGAVGRADEFVEAFPRKGRGLALFELPCEGRALRAALVVGEQA